MSIFAVRLTIMENFVCSFSTEIMGVGGRQARNFGFLSQIFLMLECKVSKKGKKSGAKISVITIKSNKGNFSILFLLLRQSLLVFSADTQVDAVVVGY
jgi:hypothetical protein